MKWVGDSVRKQKGGKEPRPSVVLVRSPDFGVGHREPLWSLEAAEEFQQSGQSSPPPRLLLSATSLRVTWKHISRATGAGFCDTSTKSSLCQQQEEYGNSNLGIFFYLPKVQTGHCSSGFGGSRVNGRKAFHLCPSSDSSKLSQASGATWRHQHCQQSLQRRQNSPSHF